MFLNEEFETHEDDIFISLLEVSSPYLSTASASEYQAVQNIILCARKLLWVASTSLDNARYPEYSVMKGLWSLRSENADKHIVTIASERQSQLGLSATHPLAGQVAIFFFFVLLFVFYKERIGQICKLYSYWFSYPAVSCNVWSRSSQKSSNISSSVCSYPGSFTWRCRLLALTHTQLTVHPAYELAAMGVDNQNR